MSENLGREAGRRTMQRRAMSQTGSGQFTGQRSGHFELPLPAASNSSIRRTSASDRSASGRGQCGVNSSQTTTPNAHTSAAAVAWFVGCTTVSGAAQRSGRGRRRWTMYSAENASTHSEALHNFTSKLEVRRRLRAARSPWTSLMLAMWFIAMTTWRHMHSRSAVLGARRPVTPSPTDTRYCFKFPCTQTSVIHSIISHRRSQGVHWMHVHPPPERRKKLLGLIYRVKVVSAAPQAEQESNFWRHFY